LLFGELIRDEDMEVSLIALGLADADEKRVIKERGVIAWQREDRRRYSEMYR
jgi:hypothetical protein